MIRFCRAGAVGINLTQANRVFLLEPCFNPALEKQAIGRVHRLGQKREVDVVRLKVKDSVESRIMTFLETKYGSISEGAHEEDLDDEDSGEEATTNKASGGIVGNVSSEKTKILTEEFDILFGAQPLQKAKAEPDGDGDDDSMKVDDVLSNANI
jgi:SNF2 family DNA or RNA helicase